jgi:hypothetical protein
MQCPLLSNGDSRNYGIRKRHLALDIYILFRTIDIMFRTLN